MPTSLDRIRTELLGRIRYLDSALTRHTISPSVMRRIDKSALQEGYVSAMWQSWCAFCRKLFIESAKGAITANGIATTSPYSANAEPEIAYVALQSSLNNGLTRVKSLSGTHLEPTWGDPRKAQLIASGLNVSNSSTISSALAAAIQLNDLQLCRNACAHISSSQISALRASKVRFDETRMLHPSDMAFWIVPSTQDFLWRSWIDEIDVISYCAIQ